MDHRYSNLSTALVLGMDGLYGACLWASLIHLMASLIDLLPMMQMDPYVNDTMFEVKNARKGSSRHKILSIDEYWLFLSMNTEPISGQYFIDPMHPCSLIAQCHC